MKGDGDRYQHSTFCYLPSMLIDKTATDLTENRNTYEYITNLLINLKTNNVTHFKNSKPKKKLQKNIGRLLEYLVQFARNRHETAQIKIGECSDEEAQKYCTQHTRVWTRGSEEHTPSTKAK